MSEKTTSGEGFEFEGLDEFSSYLPLREAVAQTLRRAILDGALGPGQTITENSLARQLSVSRTPIREAIRMLEGENLVTLVPGRRFIVSIPTVRDIEEIYDIRLILEGESLRRITPSDEGILTELEECTRLGRKYLEEDDITSLEKSNARFHSTILSVLENRTLEAFTGSIQARIARLRFYALGDREWAVRWEKDHREILRLLKAGESEGAIEVLKRHLSEPRRRLIDMFSGA